MKKYLWIYPKINLKKEIGMTNIRDRWSFYGTTVQYIKWLKNLPVENKNINKVLKKSQTWEISK